LFDGSGAGDKSDICGRLRFSQLLYPNKVWRAGTKV